MTALQKLKNIVQEMIDNGGDSDLLPVLTHIDNLMEDEKSQIIDAFTAGDYTGVSMFKSMAVDYYDIIKTV